MKSFLIILVFCFAVLQISSGNKSTDEIKSCLREHGFKDTDIGIIMTIGKPDFTDISKDISKEKLACVLACIYNKDHKSSETLHASITGMVNTDDRFSDDKRKEMLETLNNCHTEVGSDDCKLLHCIKITEFPFIDVTTTIRDVPEDLQMCFVENGLKAGDIHYLEKVKSVDLLSNILKKIDEDKLACALACAFNKQEKITPDETIHSRFTQFIAINELSDDKKKELTETLNNCNIEAAGDDCKLVKCIKLLRAPFSDLFYQKSGNKE